MRETGLNGCTYEFSVDYNAVDVDDIVKHSQIFNEKEQYEIVFEFIK